MGGLFIMLAAWIALFEGTTVLDAWVSYMIAPTEPLPFLENPGSEVEPFSPRPFTLPIDW
jgi:hypothetical protein